MEEAFLTTRTCVEIDILRTHREIITYFVRDYKEISVADIFPHTDLD